MNTSRTKAMEVGTAKSEYNWKKTYFMPLFWQRMDKSMGMIANNCSFHGWNWYLKVSKSWKKVLVSLVLNCVFTWVMCECLIRMFNLYYSLNNISASEKENLFKEHPYPKLTLCHPILFNGKLLNGKL